MLSQGHASGIGVNEGARRVQNEGKGRIERQKRGEGRVEDLVSGHLVAHADLDGKKRKKREGVDNSKDRDDEIKKNRTNDTLMRRRKDRT